MIPWLEHDTPFPALDTALTDSEGAAGLLAAGADLRPERLLDAYRKGIFPWYSEGQPILWWSTNPRMVLMTQDFKISKSLKKTLQKFQHQPHIDFVFDRAFEAVMRACAAPRFDDHGNSTGTWISEDIVAGYTRLHQMGYAHSCELWINDQLVAGAYGVGIGTMFYGESMFTRVSDGSKMVLAHLVAFLKSRGVVMIDCQQETGHLASLGAAPISRGQFIAHISAAVRAPAIMDWTVIGSGIDYD